MALDRVRGKQGYLKLFTKPVKERRRFIKFKLFVRQSISPKKDFLGQFSKCKVNILFQTGLLMSSRFMVCLDNQAYKGAPFLRLFALGLLFRVLDTSCAHMPNDCEQFVSFELGKTQADAAGKGFAD